MYRTTPPSLAIRSKDDPSGAQASEDSALKTSPTGSEACTRTRHSPERSPFQWPSATHRPSWTDRLALEFPRPGPVEQHRAQEPRVARCETPANDVSTVTMCSSCSAANFVGPACSHASIGIHDFTDSRRSQTGHTRQVHTAFRLAGATKTPPSRALRGKTGLGTGELRIGDRLQRVWFALDLQQRFPLSRPRGPQSTP